MNAIFISEEKLQKIIKTALKTAMQEANNPPPETLYSFSETARRFGVKWYTVKRWVNDGRLRATADGKFISQAAIDEYLQK